MTSSTRSKVNTLPQVNDVYVAVDRCRSQSMSEKTAIMSSCTELVWACKSNCLITEMLSR